MTNEEFDEILERTNAVVCNREWYERVAKVLEQEEYYKDLAQSYEKTIVKLKEAIAEQHSEDCVSRKAVQEVVENTIAKYIPIFIGRYEKIPLELALAIKDVPPVTPTRKKGRWIDSEILGEFKCSCCGNYWQDAEENEYEDWVNIAKYCPNCGAEMESEE